MFKLGFGSLKGGAERYQWCSAGCSLLELKLAAAMAYTTAAEAGRAPRLAAQAALRRTQQPMHTCESRDTHLACFVGKVDRGGHLVDNLHPGDVEDGLPLRGEKIHKLLV